MPSCIGFFTTTPAIEVKLAPAPDPMADKLVRLRVELTEMAFALDRRGRPEAADVAMTISGRLGEILEEIAEVERD